MRFLFLSYALKCPGQLSLPPSVVAGGLTAQVVGLGLRVGDHPAFIK